MNLRTACEEDIPAIAAMERIPAFRTFVGNWSEDEHRSCLAHPDYRYLIAETKAPNISGFAILRGLASEHHSIELKRIVIQEPGQGIGGEMLRGILEIVFCELKAHRLWLDVFSTNIRAQHVYENAGFRRDGVFREAIYRDGQYHTLILMSLLDREYAENQAKSLCATAL